MSKTGLRFAFIFLLILGFEIFSIGSVQAISEIGCSWTQRNDGTFIGSLLTVHDSIPASVVFRTFKCGGKCNFYPYSDDANWEGVCSVGTDIVDFGDGIVGFTCQCQLP
jgi:hypothetical protein